MADSDETVFQFIEEVTRNADTVQQRLLTEILTQNAQTEYLKGFNLDGATDRKTFKDKIPTVNYEDIQPFIRRIADGDRSPILTAQPVCEFLISSGTSGGERKLIPKTEYEFGRMQLFSHLPLPIMRKHVKEIQKGKGLCFRFTKPDRKTPGGLSAQSLSSSMYKRLAATKLPDVYVSPNEAILCTDTSQSMYAQMLCGLYEREKVVRIAAGYAYGLLWAIKFLKLYWKQLTHDIRTGTLNPFVTDAPIREYMAQFMQPDPELADFIARECGNDNWERIITRIWPHTKFLDAVFTGTMAQYVPALDYYSGGLPKLSMTYLASESFFGINLNPLCEPSEVAYTFMPNMAYFEFLPRDQINSSKVVHEDLVDLVDVEIGKEYELVVTSYSGLYRYRTGDLLRVTGFHNKTPNFEFVRRENMVLSISMEKTDEVQLQVAVDKASQLLRQFDTSVVEYTSYAESKVFPGHYVIYWELNVKDLANSPTDKVLEQCCLEMEESFDSTYRGSRAMHKVIGPLEIQVVKNGTFEELMEYAISAGASINQFKVPRCIKAKPIVDFLNSRVVSKHFSQSTPHWTKESFFTE